MQILFFFIDNYISFNIIILTLKLLRWYNYMGPVSSNSKCLGSNTHNNEIEDAHKRSHADLEASFPFLELIEDIQLHIFSKVKSKDLFPICLTSRNFRKLAETEWIARLNVEGIMVELTALPNLISFFGIRCSEITSLNLRGEGQIDTSLLDQFRYCNKLKNLTLHFRCDEQNNLDFSFASYCKKIESFSIDINYYHDLENLNNIPFLNILTSLKAEACYSINDISSLSKCPCLRYLDFTSCEELRNIDHLKNCKNLETLLMPGKAFEEMLLEDINGLKNCLMLKTLNLKRCEHLEDISPLEKCTLLENIDLFGTGVENIEVLRNFTSLKKLDLSWCENIEDFSPLETCVNIEEINFEGCEQISDISFLKNYSSLKILRIHDSHSENYNGEPQLVYNIESIDSLKNCLNLEKLYLSRSKIKDLSPLESCKRLKYLDISHCNQIENIGSLQHCESLEYLDISGCLEIKDLFLLEHFKSLKKLKISKKIEEKNSLMIISLIGKGVTILYDSLPILV